MRIHPKIVVENGAMDASKKYRGKINSVIMSYVKDMEEDLKSNTHSGCDPILLMPSAPIWKVSESSMKY